jgi:hypothetical protein
MSGMGDLVAFEIPAYGSRPTADSSHKILEEGQRERAGKSREPIVVPSRKSNQAPMMVGIEAQGAWLRKVGCPLLT